MATHYATDTDRLLLTVPETARRLSLSRARVYQLITAGELKSVKLGAARRIRTSDLAEYVAEAAAA